MTNFKELFESGVTAKQVEKVIKTVKLDLLDAQAYEVELTDRGFGGGNFVKVYMRSTRPKDKSDNEKVTAELSKKFKCEVDGDVIIINGVK